MNQRTNYLSLILLDALEDENESDIYNILDCNKNVDAAYVPQDRGIAPLHYVCGMENKELANEVLKRFLEMGANPNVRTEDNITPLHVAAMYGRVELVRLLLEHGAELEVYDDENKTPILYAIEECHFKTVQLIRDHIFLQKYKKHQQLQEQEKQQQHATQEQFRRVFDYKEKDTKSNMSSLQLIHKNHKQKTNGFLNNQMVKLITQNGSPLITKEVENSEKFTPNRLHYNYDITSPYYINITHRRHQPQPKFPPLPTKDIESNTIENSEDHMTSSTTDDLLSISMQKNCSLSPDIPNIKKVNIFTLTQENLRELSKCADENERYSHLSLIEAWREKVQKSRARKSIIKQYDNIGQLIDEVIENDHLNYTNIELIESTTDRQETTVNTPAAANETMTIVATNSSNEQRILNSSYETALDLITKPQTIPKIVESDEKLDECSDNRATSPKDYFLQMTEAYVHTDDENGLVFYETKLVANPSTAETNSNYCGKKLIPNANRDDGDNNVSVTTNSTNFTLPLDYETDALRAELIKLGEPPGPITRTTKRLYIKKLVRYQRKPAVMKELANKIKSNQTKFSVELHRTTKSMEQFQRIQDYAKYETALSEYFANNPNRKQMREGHLKQSFIYMLIDPRLSCNLPAEISFLDKFEIWQRFLQSIFYVGKGKTSRPYSHLYDAMKTHSRLHNKPIRTTTQKSLAKIATKKQPFNLENLKRMPLESKRSMDSKKLARILDIWSNGKGVVCLHVFHNIIPTEAYAREAAIIDALSLRHLTNCKRGDYYGPAKTWTMKEKKYLGIALLYKSMLIYLAEGESQLSPSDLI